MRKSKTDVTPVKRPKFFQDNAKIICATTQDIVPGDIAARIKRQRIESLERKRLANFHHIMTMEIR